MDLVEEVKKERDVVQPAKRKRRDANGDVEFGKVE